MGSEGSRQWRETGDTGEGKAEFLKTALSAPSFISIPSNNSVHKKLVELLFLPSSMLLAPAGFCLFVSGFFCLFVFTPLFTISHNAKIKMPSQTDSVI